MTGSDTVTGLIPRIDASSLLDAQHAHHAESLDQLRVGASEVGFFTLHNTPFSAARLNQLFNTYRAFFLLPEEDKASCDMALTGSNRGWGRAGSEQVNPEAKPDYKQVFDCGYEWPESRLPAYGNNLWPSQPPHFQRELENYYRDAIPFALDVLCSVAEAVGEDSDYFRTQFQQPMALLRGNYYPPRPASAGADVFGIASHTDYGCLTLLASDGTPGLEVKLRDGQWHAVPTVAGEFVINFGEMLEIWTRGKILATPHRVIGSQEERISVPLFFNPRYDTNVAPPGAQESFRAVDHLQARFDETYLHLQRR